MPGKNAQIDAKVLMGAIAKGWTLVNTPKVRPRVEQMPFRACPAGRTPRSNRSGLLDLFLTRNAC
jgi:hypothetical protein